MPHQAGDEGEIFLTASNELGDGEVVDFEAEASAATVFWFLQRNEPLTPAVWQHGGVGSHAMGIVAECLMRNGEPSPIEPSIKIAVRRVVERENVGLDGSEQVSGVAGNWPRTAWLPTMTNS